MIAFLSGLLLHTEHDAAVLDVQGVGYEVHVSARTRDSLPQPGGKVALHIFTSVREDAITLYGFPDSSEKRLFLLLNTVSGIGPKLALAILSGMEPAALGHAVGMKDIRRLTALPGVGKKTAERLCMELADKMQPFSSSSARQSAAASSHEGFAMHDAASALMNLGYPQETAWQALRSIQQADPVKTARLRVDELIRAALRSLA